MKAENKINIAKLLKNCPLGTELYSPITGDCTFVLVGDNVIRVHFYGGEDEVSETCFYEYDNYFHNGECLLFPSKDKTTWKGFIPPKPKFKCGDVIACDCHDGNSQLFIFKEYDDNNDTVCYLFLDTDGTLETDEFAWKTDRLATEEEKRELFDTIKANSYRWNEETKTLEKLPIFKVGDRIKHIVGREEIATVVGVEKLHYNLDSKVGTSSFSISLQHEWELVPDKFDINTLVPFESKVLVRDTDYHKWEGAWFGRYDGGSFFTIGGIDWKYCIPYEGNEHLHGTTKKCDDYFKTWKDE